MLFGGVYDFEESEENLDSEFYNQLYTYHIESNRWYNFTFKTSKKKKKETIKRKTRDEDLEEILNSILAKANLNDNDNDGEEEEIDNEEMNKIEQLKQLEKLMSQKRMLWNILL